ncbi:MAG TPA: hypothetical protein GXX20_06505 [Clostridiaceae bacterium]|nr:hypothetical protein [Clostridiaceae bacterium]
MPKKQIIIGTIIIVVLLGVSLIYRYAQYILVLQANPYINVDGVKLMMTEEKVKSLLGEEEEYMPGYAGCAFRLNYHSKGIYLIFLGDIDTDFYHKVNEIKITNSNYEIFNVRIGDNYEEAIKKIRKRGFTREKEGFPGCWKMNMYIVLEKSYDKVKSITIGVRDRVASTRIY